jgi:hypothetical protein
VPFSSIGFERRRRYAKKRRLERLNSGDTPKMKSPFPGMDPYIEACGLWGDFHLDLVSEIKHALARAAPERYLVRAGERSYIVLVEEEGKKEHPFDLDVSVTTKRREKQLRKQAGTALAEPTLEAEPVLMRAFIEDEHREAFVEIYEAAPEERLVTCVEVLSPANKRPNTPGWDIYHRKRQSLLQGDTNLVEIDLLRGGRRMPMLDPWPDSPYAFLVARAKKFGLCKVWPVRFQTPRAVASCAPCQTRSGYRAGTATDDRRDLRAITLCAQHRLHQAARPAARRGRDRLVESLPAAQAGTSQKPALASSRRRATWRNNRARGAQNWPAA